MTPPGGIDTSTPVERQSILEQVDRIVQSPTFRNSAALCRLLRYLVDKLLAGEADHIKEYSVAIDALEKPDSFDPKRDSSVRLQIGRLRQKLPEYYRMDGTADTWLIDLPKGSFRITVQKKPPQTVNEAPPPQPVPGKPRSSIGWFIAAAVLLAWAGLATWGFVSERQKNSLQKVSWTPDLELLWRPYLTSSRPLIVAIEEPPFVQFKGFGVYRELSLNRWPNYLSSPNVAAIRQTFHNAETEPYYYYAPIGEVQGAFQLGKLLGTRVSALSLVGSRNLSWQQIANNNVIYLGVAVFVSEQLKGLPMQMQLIGAPGGGWTNLHPRLGESAVYKDQLPSGPAADGEVYALVTHAPGPLGTGDVMLFFSAASAGRLGAVEWFTSGNHAAMLMDQMKDKDGHFPAYYQVLLRVRYKDEVPTEASYVLHRELKLMSGSSTGR